MMCLDVFLMGLSTEERQALQSCIVPNIKFKHPLECFDVVALSWQEKLHFSHTDKQYLQKLALQMQWQNDLEVILQKSYQALVLTDTERVIVWVNKGFEAMTGYKAREAIGKKPTFLQGENTNPNSRLQFREKIQAGKNFDLTITNYRKNGEEYLCKVEVFPLCNVLGQVSHFLALEQEIR